MQTPNYLLEVLIGYLPALEAERQQQLNIAAMLPHLDDDDRKDFLRGLTAAAAPLEPILPLPENVTLIDPTTLSEEERAKARAWFAARGVRVQAADPS